MSTAAMLLAEIGAVGADATLENGVLCISAPDGALTEEQCRRLIELRAEIIALLAEPANDCYGPDMSGGIRPVAAIDLPADLMLAFEERAAIAEFDSGLDRAAAERLAWAEVTGSEP